MSISATARQELAPEAWNAFVDEDAAGWWWQRGEWLDYCLTYDGDAEDRSFAVLEGDRVVGIVPLIISRGCLTMGGELCAGALLADSTQAATVWAMMETRLTGVTDGGWRWSPLARRLPAIYVAPITWDDASWTTAVVDLTQDLDTLWRGLRKSYKAIIHRAERRYRIVQTATFEAYQAIHASVSGARRDDRTYDAQRQWVQDNHAVVITAHGDAGREVADAATSAGSTPAISTTSAAAYAIVYKDWAYNASAPSVVRNVQHGVQWAMIKALKNLGVTYYEVGWIDHATDAKGMAVEYFKRGFGGDPWPVRAVRMR